DIPDAGTGGLVWALIHGYLNWRFGMRRTPSNRFGAWVFSAIEPLRLKLDYYGRHLTRVQFPQPGRLLDVGCGNGAFLMRAREAGWHVAGCEPDAKAVAACRAQGLDVIQGDIFNTALDGQLFDVVTISHVLEHVVDPQALLKRAYMLLCPGGVLWVALPNPHSLGLRIFGAAWRGLHVPFHLCIPSQTRLRRWMETTGFVSTQMMRRGTHSKRLWADSLAIAHREQIAIRSSATVATLRAVTDFLAALAPRWAEETVMIARKPETSDAG
ncbi:MAG: methyltransferase domain-containing protein, partial [Betaproteobacteria bacterium]|nr:methyltransferase domain-containing protein [Betaproteobacteria bacterium]